MGWRLELLSLLIWYVEREVYVYVDEGRRGIGREASKRASFDE